MWVCTVKYWHSQYSVSRELLITKGNKWHFSSSTKQMWVCTVKYWHSLYLPPPWVKPLVHSSSGLSGLPKSFSFTLRKNDFFPWSSEKNISKLLPYVLRLFIMHTTQKNQTFIKFWLSLWKYLNNLPFLSPGTSERPPLRN